jgi:hypothetical protein
MAAVSAKSWQRQWPFQCHVAFTEGVVGQARGGYGNASGGSTRIRLLAVSLTKRLPSEPTSTNCG